MAPEQATGDPATDHRADIYSFGCLAYEVLTGKPPFWSEATHRVIAAHFQELPRPVRERRADVPDAIGILIARCLEKDPARRPQSATEVLAALELAPSQAVVHAPRTAVASLAAAALGLIAIVAGVAYIRAHAALRESAVPQPFAFAAVPFRNLSRDAALEYRAEGMSDEILTAMSKVAGIQIVGRNAARRYKGIDVIDERAVERELGARFLVTGTYSQANGRLVVSVQLNDSLTHGELWAGSFNRETVDFGAVTDSIARGIVDTLRARFAGRFGQPTRGALSSGTTNSAALEAYLVGRALFRRRGSGIKQSVASFESAVRLDAKFARAHAALAEALSFLPYYNGVTPDDVRDRTVAAAQRALELDSTLADAHQAIAMTEVLSGRWDKASAEYEIAERLEPDNFEAHFNYGRVLTLAGKLTDARRHLDLARTLERVSPLVSTWSSYVSFLGGDTASALMENERAVQLDPALLPAVNLGALMNIATGHPDVARRLMTNAWSVTTMSNAPYIYAKLGDTATAFRMLSAMDANNPRPWFTDVQRGTVMLALGDTARALRAFDESARTVGPVWVELIPPGDPAFDPIRKSPHFVDLIRRAGLDMSAIVVPRVKR